MLKLAFAVISVGLCGSLGCNQIADINDPISKEGAGSALGTPPGTTPGDGTTPGGDKSMFLGSWSGGGTVTQANCTVPEDNGTGSGSGSVSFTESPSGLRFESKSCTGAVTVSGNVATAVAGVVCLDSDGLQVKIEKWSFTLTSSTSAKLHLSAQKIWEDGATCDYTQEGEFTKGAGGT